MSKSLNDILRRYSDALAGKRESSIAPLTTGENPGVDYADKMKDSRDFIAQHSVERFDDRVGNGDDVYKAAKIKKAIMDRHGHEPKPKDIKVYNKNQQVGQKENVKEEVENLDEITLSKKTKLRLYVRARDRMLAGMDNRSDDEYKTGKRLQDMIDKRKVRKEEVEELDESKCNMSEAGSMCEVHGKKACPKENSASDKEPRYNGKKKEGKQLITDKKLNEKLTKDMTAGEVIKDFEKSDDPRFKGDSKEKRKQRALAAYYKMQKEETLDESILDQRSAKATASEKAREKIFAALERRKEKAMDHKMKMKEQAAPVDTPITFPTTNSREGLRV